MNAIQQHGEGSSDQQRQAKLTNRPVYKKERGVNNYGFPEPTSLTWFAPKVMGGVAVHINHYKPK